MVKASYSRVGYGIVAIVLAGVSIAGIQALLAAMRVQPSYGDAGLGVFQNTLCFGIIIIGYVCTTILSVITAWRKSSAFDRRRQAAACGEGITLQLNGELQTDVREPPPLPTVIQLRMAWRSTQAGSTFAQLFALFQVIALVTLIALFSGGSSYGWPAPFIILVTECLCIALLAMFYPLFAASSRLTIRLADEGISVRRIGRWRHIRWDEARLFALTGSNQYELASEHVIIRWWRTSRNKTAQPTIPYEEYQRRMDGLLLLVRERTGLPLYAVVKERS